VSRTKDEVVIKKWGPAHALFLESEGRIDFRTM